MKWDDSSTKKLRTMWGQGVSINEIADHLGVSYGSVTYQRKKLGLPVHPNAQNPPYVNPARCNDCQALMTAVNEHGCPVPRCDHYVPYVEPERTLGGVVGVLG